MKKRGRFLILPFFTLILEALPYGAVMYFANMGGKSIRSTYSYFDLPPFGYANFSPLLTAVITGILTAALLIWFILGKGWIIKLAKNTAITCAAISLWVSDTIRLSYC
ncbi:MAG: hypothetical protein IJY69_04200 [Clostridia bacterium]|nr:hypothetical protein [Clostridia bacterium]